MRASDIFTQQALIQNKLNPKEIKLLLLDNDESTWHILQSYFEDAENMVFDYSAWAEAPQIMGNFDPDIVLTTVVRPFNEGIEVLRQLVKNNEKKEFIILSDYTDIHLSTEMLRLGICDIITKPICPDELEKALDKAKKRINRTRSQDEFFNSIDRITRIHLNMEDDNEMIPKNIVQGTIHNLNSPLSVISGNAQLIKVGMESIITFLKNNKSSFEPSVYKELNKKYKRHKEFINNVLSSSEKLKDIICGLLAKWRKESLEQSQEIDINEFINLEINYFKSNLQFKNNVNKLLDLADNLPKIKGVYSDFSQTFQNLVNNALDAMYNAPKMELKIVTRYTGELILIDIHDTGCGITPDQIDQIFKPFFTTKPTASTKSDGPKGTGIGLANCVELMKAYDSTFNVVSTPGHGTCITWKIPAKKIADKNQPEPTEINIRKTEKDLITT